MRIDQHAQLKRQRRHPGAAHPSNGRGVTEQAEYGRRASVDNVDRVDGRHDAHLHPSHERNGELRHSRGLGRARQVLEVVVIDRPGRRVPARRLARCQWR